LPAVLLRRSNAVAKSLRSMFTRGTPSALNRYKHAIFLHNSVNGEVLVQRGIGAILHTIEQHLKEVQQ
jgi:hypothetical protein